MKAKKSFDDQLKGMRTIALWLCGLLLLDLILTSIEVWQNW